MYITIKLELPVNPPSLWEAAYRGDLKGVKRLLGTGADYRERASTNKCTALHVAALHGHMDIVYELIQVAETARSTYSNFNVCNSMDDKKLTPLHYACSRLMIQVCEMLIRFGAASSTGGCQYMQPVLYAACAGKYIEGMYGDGPQNGINGDGPHYENDRIRRMQLQTVQLLLENGADVSSCKWSGTGAMIWEVAIESYTDTALLSLLLHAVKVTGKSIPVSRSGDTIMHYVADLNYHFSRNGADIKMLEMLRHHARETHNNTLDISTQNRRGYTTLYAACNRDKVDTVKYLLDNGVDPPTEDSLDDLYRVSNAQIWDMIVTEFNQREERNIAFAMATHPRVGAGSHARSLPPELFRVVQEQGDRGRTCDMSQY
jgi:ankyrin repeat protein